MYKILSMKTLSLEMGKMPHELKIFFEKNDLQHGDKILILAGKEQERSVLFTYLVMLALTLYSFFQKKEKKGAGASELPGMNYEELLEKESPEAIEDVIEDKLGVQLEISEEEEEFNPIDAAFGIWKDRDITIEKIRKMAWERTK